MIKDWIKFVAYREKLMMSVKKKFSSIEDETFFDYFQDAYLEKFPVFESKFDPTKSDNEPGYLYRLIVNKINDLLKSQLSTNSLIEIGVDDDYEDNGDEANSDTITFSEFLLNAVTQRSGLNDKDTENYIAVNKHYKIITPLIKMEAWASKVPLTNEILIKLADKVSSDLQSEQFYDWAEPTVIVRLKSWVGCS